MTTKSKKTTKKPRIARGILLALFVIPAGIVAWLFLWQYGFIASVVAWGIALGAVWLYGLGAGAPVSRPAVPYLLGVILLGIILAFLSGVVSDVWFAYTNELGGQEGFWSEDFWLTVVTNLTAWDVMSQYTMDFVISIAFAALGAGGVVYGLYKDSPVRPKKQKKA